MPALYPNRRRPRECKTCLPCRASKVRCDRNMPCGYCIDHNFTCSYGRPLPPTKFPAPSASITTSCPPLQSDSFVSPPIAPSNIEPPPPRYGTYISHLSVRDSNDPDFPEIIDTAQSDWDEINSKIAAMEQILGNLHSMFSTLSSRELPDRQESELKVSTRSEGVYGTNVLKNGAVHLGSRSALVDILDKSKSFGDTAQALSQEDLMAGLVLGNESAAYPFLDLWTSDPSVFNIVEVCAALPDDEQCERCVMWSLKWAFWRCADSQSL